MSEYLETAWLCLCSKKYRRKESELYCKKCGMDNPVEKWNYDKLEFSRQKDIATRKKMCNNTHYGKD